ncbi:MAG: TIGR00341 family protein, partial [Haloferacaceae archaeon]
GLLLDSPAVVVGSMVIAPLIGPAMATSVGTVVNDRDLFRRGVTLQLLGGVVAVASAAAFALVLRGTNVVPVGSDQVFAASEIQERVSPDVLSLAVALGAGVAGALSLSTGVSTALVGVMIAAALIPPTAVVGIGIAWQRPEAVVGSGILVLVNFLSINFAALAVLWYEGYRPEQFLRLDEAKTATLKNLAVLGVGILVLSAFLGGVTYSSYQTATFERQTNAAVEETVAAHDDLSVVSVDVRYRDTPLFSRPSRVVVTVGYPLGSDPPRLAADLDRRINALDHGPFSDILGRDRLDVEVRYVAVDDSG